MSIFWSFLYEKERKITKIYNNTYILISVNYKLKNHKKKDKIENLVIIDIYSNKE